MNTAMAETPPVAIEYPESDGKPMADNTKQFVWIVVLYGNLAAQYHDNEDVFVGGNQNWYPRQGEPEVVAAPDVYVVFGRPKGHRRSWKQWEENDVPMTVVFEVLSPGNTWIEMVDKHSFYDEYGVEEYYIYDPDTNFLVVYQRGRETLRRIHKVDGFVSPRLGIRFDLTGPEMIVYHPDGRPFLSFEEVEAQRACAERRVASQQERADAAERRAASQQERAASAERRAERIAVLSRKLLAQQATPEEIQDLQQLIAPPALP